MIKDNQKYFNRLHVVLDAIVVTVSYMLAWYLKFASPISNSDPNVGALSMGTYFEMLILIVPGCLILYYTFNLYTAKRATVHKYEILNIFQANTVGLVILMAGWYMVSQIHFSRLMMGYFYLLNIILTALVRSLIRVLLQYFREKGYNLKYILLVGYSRAAEEYIGRINSNPQWGYVVRGILDDSVPSGTLYKGVKVLGRIDNLLYILPQNKLDEIAITLSLKDYDHLERIVDMCEKSGVHTKFIPDYNSLFPSRPYTEDLMGLPVINIRYVPLSNTLNWIAKRIVDIVTALVGLVVSFPVMLCAAIAVGCTSRGPIIFKQERIGLHNKPFKMYKFRTMEVQKPSKEAQGWTTKDDPRVTKVGKFLRRTSIDKHQVRPGLTGWAQINGYRGDTSIKRRIEYDIFYIENWTMSFDIKIMFLTIFKGFINKNAY